MNTIRIMLAAAAMLAATLAQAALGNLSDVWYDPADPGWGVYIVQQDDAAMVTVMTYAADGEPVWYAALPATAYAWSGDGLPYLRGTLYRTRARAPGAPSAADPVQVVPVGTLYVSPVDRGRARLDYTVNGVAISRPIERMTWRLPAIDSMWSTVFSLRVNRGDGTVVRQTTQGAATLAIEDGIATLSVTGEQSRCDYRGSYLQSGRLGSFAGEFSCSNGRAGRFHIDDLELTTQGISGRFRATEPDGNSYGTFGGPRR